MAGMLHARHVLRLSQMDRDTFPLWFYGVFSGALMAALVASFSVTQVSAMSNLPFSVGSLSYKNA